MLGLLAEVSPTYNTAMTIIGLVINCPWSIPHVLPPLFHTRYIYLIIIYLNNIGLLFLRSLLSCKVTYSFLQSNLFLVSR